ncbi:MAG: type I-E CRISPR-associated protein Cas5/CasD [Candidatus Contendobacter sp.]|nr:type I-E CRISPR-associated protein Cas5/CasD [Candidatus Contendobacter sp.]MDG4556685.1 type I-E CRISPR-associated protein Cas5/CasD [Candidatus Contendobacter sp.]
MPQFLILRLDGPMQAWGMHTYEDFRPSNNFPTRSGLLGLIGACLGLDRKNCPALERLSQSLEFTVRVDRQVSRPGEEKPRDKDILKLRDFHTVSDARKVDGSRNQYPIVSQREYLHDAAFTVAVMEKPNAGYSLRRIIEALRRPLYTPVLGRRSCPLARPLLESGEVVEAENAKAALDLIPLRRGLIYAEGEAMINARLLPIRDVPLHGRHRQFGARRIYVHAPD